MSKQTETKRRKLNQQLMEEHPLLTTFGDNKSNKIVSSTHFGGIHDNIEVIFRNHEQRLIEIINNAPDNGFIACAIAWFTNYKILDALGTAKERGVAIFVVVRKEDFLRPDNLNDQSFKSILRKKYDRLGLNVSHDNSTLFSNFILPALDEEYCGIVFHKKYDAVRCVGNHNSNKNPSASRMHHKFIVFGVIERDNQKQKELEDKLPANMDEETKKDIIDWENPLKPIPQFVWTGSFNLSCSACHSFENVVIIKKPEIALMYYREFSLLYVLSEPLDWSSIWMEPKFAYHCT